MAASFHHKPIIRAGDYARELSSGAQRDLLPNIKAALVEPKSIQELAKLLDVSELRIAAAVRASPRHVYELDGKVHRL